MILLAFCDKISVMRSAEIGRNVTRQLDGKPEHTETAIALMQLVARLEDVPFTREHHFGAATIGAAVRRYDDAFDVDEVGQARRNGLAIASILEGAKPAVELDGRIIQSIHMAQEVLTSEAIDALRQLTKAQVDSIEQRTGRPTPKRLEDITRRKGGSTILLFALEMRPDLDEEGRECYEQLGYLRQLIDDYADRVIDTKAGVVTLANVDPSSVRIVSILQRQHRHVKSLFSERYGASKTQPLFQFIDNQIARTGLTAPLDN